MDAKLVGLLLLGLAACATPSSSLTEPANPHGFIWLATAQPFGENAIRSAEFQQRVAAAFARRGYEQDARGALGVAISFTGTDDPSLGPLQGGYAVFTPDTQCSAVVIQSEQPMLGA